MAKDYETLYKGSKLYWGSKPSDLVKQFAELAPMGEVLDLGMGEGRDVLYLASLGFKATGIESTESGVEKCLKLSREKKLPVKAILADARNFKIAKSRYSLIACVNLLQFLTKDEARILIEKAMNGLKRGGLFLCETFTTDDPFYRVHRRRSKEIAPGVFICGSGKVHTFYSHGELLKICADLRPIYYREYDYYDTSHGAPHWHGKADLVGKK